MHIIIVSGGFDPIHSGHISYLESSKNWADKLFVALNSDKWLEKKKGRHFMPFNERENNIRKSCCRRQSYRFWRMTSLEVVLML